MQHRQDTSQSPAWQRLLRISGDDRISFLQGQLTQDVSRLSAADSMLLAASCDPKGRVLAVLTLIWQPDCLLAMVRDDIADSWVAQVLRYRMRARVDIEPADAWQVAGGLAPADGGEMQWCLGELHERLLPAQTAMTGADLDSLAWRMARLRAGVVEVGPSATGKYTPHMLNLDRLGALSFNKGCYTGQEVVARTEHLGAVKRRARLLGSSDGSEISETAAVCVAERKIGGIAAAAGSLAMAVMSDADAGGDLRLDDGRTLLRPVTD